MTDSLFLKDNTKVNWSQVNGQEQMPTNWGDEPVIEEESEKYKHQM